MHSLKTTKKEMPKGNPGIILLDVLSGSPQLPSSVGEGLTQDDPRLQTSKLMSLLPKPCCGDGEGKVDSVRTANADAELLLLVATPSTVVQTHHRWRPGSPWCRGSARV